MKEINIIENLFVIDIGLLVSTRFFVGMVGSVIGAQRSYDFQIGASNIFSAFFSEASVFLGMYMEAKSRDFLFQFEGTENKYADLNASVVA